MHRIGPALRETRERRKLTLREVEERSAELSHELAYPSYRISASLLDQLEQARHELTATELCVLAYIYQIAPEQFISSVYPHPSRSDPSWDENTELASVSHPLQASYKWGIIGRDDSTLEPLLPAGSLVQIDTARREIGPAQKWTNLLQRPIYFLRCQSDYFCGWCDLDPTGTSLTLVPHPLSRAPARHWGDRSEVEVIGLVVAAKVVLPRRYEQHPRSVPSEPHFSGIDRPQVDS